MKLRFYVLLCLVFHAQNSEAKFIRSCADDMRSILATSLVDQARLPGGPVSFRVGFENLADAQAANAIKFFASGSYEKAAKTRVQVSLPLGHAMQDVQYAVVGARDVLGNVEIAFELLQELEAEVVKRAHALSLKREESLLQVLDEWEVRMGFVSPRISESLPHRIQWNLLMREGQRKPSVMASHLGDFRLADFFWDFSKPSIGEDLFDNKADINFLSSNFLWSQCPYFNGILDF